MLFNIINDCFNPDDTLINETLSSYCLFVGLVFLMIEFPTFQENSDFLLCRGDVEGKILSLAAIIRDGRLKICTKQSSIKLDYRYG